MHSIKTARRSLWYNIIKDEEKRQDNVAIDSSIDRTSAVYAIKHTGARQSANISDAAVLLLAVISSN